MAVINDKELSELMVSELMEYHQYTKEQALDFVKILGSTIVDSMWFEYSSSLHYYIDIYDKEHKDKQ